MGCGTSVNYNLNVEEIKKQISSGNRFNWYALKQHPEKIIPVLKLMFENDFVNIKATTPYIYGMIQHYESIRQYLYLYINENNIDSFLNQPQNFELITDFGTIHPDEKQLDEAIYWSCRYGSLEGFKRMVDVYSDKFQENQINYINSKSKMKYLIKSNINRYIYFTGCYPSKKGFGGQFNGNIHIFEYLYIQDGEFYESELNYILKHPNFKTDPNMIKRMWDNGLHVSIINELVKKCNGYIQPCIQETVNLYKKN